MIKHRFILRGEDDFRIFAAIPVERTVLKWEKWLKTPDDAAWELLAKITHELHATTKSLTRTVMAASATVATAIEFISAEKDRDGASTLLEYTRETEHWLQEVAANTQPVEGWLHKLAGRLATPLGPWSAIAAPKQEFHKILDLCMYHTKLVDRPTELRESIETFIKAAEYQVRVLSAVKPFNSENKYALQKSIRINADYVAHGRAMQIDLQHIDRGRDLLLRLTEAAGLCCPEGVPFACYTIELHNIVVDVIEGCAWLNQNAEEDEQLRILTEDEKRVVEIVSQMLTERALNPKADTRIPVIPVNPAHERDVRAAEDRDVKASPTGTRLRTIKFTVSPPRYLRAAAERILSSPRKAHWVVGHWRDQAYGTAHQLRRSTWIKPHIRGLGEAGAITVRIAAPDEKTGN